MSPPRSVKFVDCIAAVFWVLCPSVPVRKNMGELITPPLDTRSRPVGCGPRFATHTPAVHVAPSSHTLPAQHGWPPKPQPDEHTPPAQTPVSPHARPHIPQLARSVDTSTHTPEHTMAVPPSQVAPSVASGPLATSLALSTVAPSLPEASPGRAGSLHATIAIATTDATNTRPNANGEFTASTLSQTARGMAIVACPRSAARRSWQVSDDGLRRAHNGSTRASRRGRAARTESFTP